MPALLPPPAWRSACAHAPALPHPCRVQQFTAAGAALAATDGADGALSIPVGIATLSLGGVPASTLLVADSSLDAIVVYTQQG